MKAAIISLTIISVATALGAVSAQAAEPAGSDLSGAMEQQAREVLRAAGDSLLMPAEVATIEVYRVGQEIALRQRAEAEAKARREAEVRAILREIEIAQATASGSKIAGENQIAPANNIAAENK